MNAKISVFAICVDEVNDILLLYNLHDMKNEKPVRSKKKANEERDFFSKQCTTKRMHQLRSFPFFTNFNPLLQIFKVCLTILRYCKVRG